jgi:hypothetical protein
MWSLMDDMADCGTADELFVVVQQGIAMTENMQVHLKLRF